MNRSVSMILAVLLCGLPGSCLCLFSAMLALSGTTDSNQWQIDTGFTNPEIMRFGLIGVAIGIALASVPVVLWLRRRARR